MNNQFKVGNIVCIYKTGLAGEVIKVIVKDLQMHYHVKVPAEDETYKYQGEDLYLFPPLAQQNIRNEWEKAALLNADDIKIRPVSLPVGKQRLDLKNFGFIDKIKLVLKVFMLIMILGLLTSDGFAQNKMAKNSEKGYDKIGKFENKRARVSLNGLWGIIDLDGKEILEPKYEKIGMFKNRKARVMVNKRWGIVNWDGNMIIKPVYNKIGYFKNGRAKVLKDGRWGIVHQDGNEIVPPKYEKILDFENGRAKVMLNDLWGIIDISGKEIVSPKYHKIHKFENKRSKVYLNGRWGLIDWEGNEIVALE